MILEISSALMSIVSFLADPRCDTRPQSAERNPLAVPPSLDGAFQFLSEGLELSGDTAVVDRAADLRLDPADDRRIDLRGDLDRLTCRTGEALMERRQSLRRERLGGGQFRADDVLKFF